MVERATVISIRGALATVEAVRTSACDDCKMPCPASRQKGKLIRLDVPAVDGLKPGDEVELEAQSRSVLGMAFMVYIFPLLMALAGYLTASALGAQDRWAALTAFILLIVSFVPAFLINGRLKRRQGGIYTVRRVAGG